MDDATGLAEALVGTRRLPGARRDARTPTRCASRSRRRPTWSGASAVGCGRSPRNAGVSTSETCPASGARPGSSGSSAAGAVPIRTARHKTWTEGSPHVPSRAVLTVRAGAEATRQVGALALPVAVVARELGVCWWTVMDAVDAPRHAARRRPRIAWATCGPSASTRRRSSRPRGSTPRIYATGMVDLDDPRILIDLIEGNGATDLRRWCAEPGPAVARDDRGGGHRPGRELSARHRRAPRPHRARRRSLPRRARRQPLRRQGAPTGAERDARAPGTGRPTRSIGSASSCSPAPSASTSAVTSACCSGCAAGDPHDELLGAWLAKESVRDVYLTERVGEARILLEQGHRRVPGRRGRRDPLPRRHPRALADRDLEPPPHRGLQRSRPKASTCA